MRKTLKKNLCLFALLLFILSPFLLYPQISDQEKIKDAEKIESQLSRLEGKDRIKPLVELMEAYRRFKPQKAVDYGTQALYLLNTSPDLKIRAQVLNHMSNAYRFLGEFEKAREHAEVSLKYAGEIDDKTGEAAAHYSLGIIHLELGEFDKSLEHYSASERLFYELKDYKNQAMALNSIGGTYRDLGDFPNSLEYLLKALVIFESLQDQWGISIITSNIADVYKELKDFDTSLEYNRKALKIFEARDDQVSAASTYNSIAEINRLQHKYDEALRNSREALKISEKTGIKKLSYSILKEIGDIYKELQNYDLALENLNRSLALREELNEKIDISDVLIDIASIHRLQGHYEEAAAAAARALDIAKEINLKAKLGKAYLELSQIYEAVEDYEKAFDYYKRHKEITDTIFNEDTTRKITSLRTNYSIQQKEKEIQILKIDRLNQRIVLVFLLLFAFLLMALAFVVFTRYRLKARVTTALQKEVKERQQTELKLRESEEKFRILAEKSVVGIWIIQNNRIKYVNPRCAKIFGRNQEDILGIDPVDLVLQEDRLMVIDHMDKRMEGTANSLSNEFRGVNKEGDIINLESYGSTTLYEGTPALLESIIDITRRKKAETELLRSNKMESIGILAGGIAHDFNNLLAVIVGNISMLKLSYGEENPRMNQYLDNVERASHQAADLAQKFITFSEGGWLMRKKVKLINILKDTIQLSPIIKDISYETFIPPDIDYIYGDERQLRQVMTNLLINAHEATVEQFYSKIVVNAQNIYLDNENPLNLKEGKYVKVSVADNGKGIPHELLEKIFDPYFSTKNTYNQKGLGMGLPICYSIIKKHEGHINIISTVKKGTTVELILPVFKEK